MRLAYTVSKAIGSMRAMTTSTKFLILELPDELVTIMVEHINDLKTLLNLATTCRRLQDIAEQKIYRHLFFRTGRKTYNCYAALRQLPNRAKAIQSIQIPCDHKHIQRFAMIEKTLIKANNLRDLMIESPECNNGEFEEEEAWQEMARHIFNPFSLAINAGSTRLQRLQKCENTKNSGLY